MTFNSKSFVLVTVCGIAALASNGFSQDKKTDAAAGPTDPQIAAIVVTANQVDIDAGKMAEHKSKNPEVQKFAKSMVTDHTGVNKQASDLVKKLKVTPEENPTSRGLKDSADKTMADLKALNGAAFDKAYVDNEVAYHQTVMGAMDSALIPNAKNAELKALLIKVRPAFVAHLEHAKHLQSSMMSGTSKTAH